MKIKIPLLCRSKKNSQRIIYNPKTKRPMIIQSEINLKCLFYVPDRRKRDLTNLENAIADILVKYEILEDDNYNIIAGWDGSRIIYEKGKEETEIEITKM